MTGSLSVVVPIVVEIFSDHRARMAPLAARAWMTHGEEPDARSELKSFLEEQLANASPTDVVRLTSYGSEGHHTLRTVTVPLALSPADREETRSGHAAVPFDVGCVVLGAHARSLERALSTFAQDTQTSQATLAGRPALPERPGETWIAIPVLDHVFRLPDDVPLNDEAALDGAIAHEVIRVVAASCESPLDVLAFAPPSETRIERMELDLKRPELARGTSQTPLHEAERLRQQAQRRLLETMGRRIERTPAPPLRQASIVELHRLLSSSERLAVLVRGPELAGKSAVLEHVLGERAGLAYAIPLARFLAGDGGFGDWQTQVERTFSAAENLDATIYIEDLGSLALERPGSPVDLGAAMAPYLESRRVRFVGEIRDEELDRFETRHRRLASTLLRVRVEPMTERETIEVLLDRVGAPPKDTTQRGLSREAIEALVPLVTRYVPGRALPGEALRVADAIIDTLIVARDERGALPPIEREELANAFAERVGIPQALVRDELPMPPSEIEAALGARVIGQAEAVTLVAQTLAVVKADLPPRNKPIATFLFVGPTGTGKTELARSLASYLFGSGEALARFDMSEFMDPWAAERLIRGTDRDDGLLTRRARERPFSVLLLDEIEKAHPSVFDLLLQVLGEGRLTDARGKTASFTSSIVIMTSNLGARSDKPAVGFGGAGFEGPDAERLRSERYLRAVRDHFRPELLNRIDRVIPFRGLTAAEATDIARIFVRGIERRAGLLDKRLVLELDDDALAHVIDGVMQSGGGARALRRVLEDTLVSGLAHLLATKPAFQARVAVSLPHAPRLGPSRIEHAGLSFQVVESKRHKSPARGPLDAITALRRRLSRWSRLSSLDSMRSEVMRLIAEVARAKRRGDERVSDAHAQRLGVLQSRITEVDTLLRSLEACEEDALRRMMSDEDPAPCLPQAHAIAWALEGAMWHALQAWGADDDTVDRTAIVLDRSKRAMSLFVLPLLRERSLGQVLLHLPASIPVPQPAGRDVWPPERAWGPDLSAEAAHAFLGSSPRLTQPLWGVQPAMVFMSFDGFSTYLLLQAVEGLIRFRQHGEVHDLLLGDPEGPWDALKLPEVAAVPSRPKLLIDLDRGVIELEGAADPIAIDPPDESRPHAERDEGRWVRALPRVALAMQAVIEGL